ncbi:MAG: dipeptidase [Clostridia bacterium]|nr:dipeptidase [Clostridia bacterium]
MIPYSVIDAHCDTLTMLEPGQHLLDCPKHYNVQKQSEYIRFLQVMDLWVDKGEHSVDARVDQYIDFYAQEVARTPGIQTILTRDDLVRYFTHPAPQNPAWLLGIEGGECVDASLERLQELFRCGVRLITLTWNTPNRISDTNVVQRPEGPGLTAYGREVVREMNRLGVIVDVSHISDAGFYDVLEISSKPIVASHSNARKLCGHSRNLTDDMFKALVQNGGVTGMNFCTEFLGGSEDLEQIVRHIEYFAALGGIKNIGMGSDFDGIDELPGGVKGTESLYRIFDRLLQLNYTDQQVDDIAWRNFYRVFSDVLPSAEE